MRTHNLYRQDDLRAGHFKGIIQKGQSFPTKDSAFGMAFQTGKSVIPIRRDLAEIAPEPHGEEVKEALASKEIIGQSPALRLVLEQIGRVASTDATVLILGESGTGKELVASAIHECSARRHHPLVRVNCASVPAELFESEFFGHIKGAFTGALRDRVGRFQHADGGTLFLDEVGEIPPSQQAKLLRVLQEGSSSVWVKTRRVPPMCGLIAATNRNLTREMEAGRFRQDLYYRLGIFPVEVPPLRDAKRPPSLGDPFPRRSCARLKRPEVRLTNDDVNMLARYDWPGHVRELQHVIERAVILAQGIHLRLNLALTQGAARSSYSLALPQRPRKRRRP